MQVSFKREASTSQQGQNPSTSIHPSRLLRKKGASRNHAARAKQLHVIGNNLRQCAPHGRPPIRRGGQCDSFRILFKQANEGRPRTPSMKLIMDRPSTGRRERLVVDIHTRHDNYLSLLLFFPFGHAALQMDCEHVRKDHFLLAVKTGHTARLGTTQGPLSKNNQKSNLPLLCHHRLAQKLCFDVINLGVEPINMTHTATNLSQYMKPSDSMRFLDAFQTQEMDEARFVVNFQRWICVAGPFPKICLVLLPSLI